VRETVSPFRPYLAGRAECTIRRTPVPVTYVDFHGQFSTVSEFLGGREISCAESLEFPDFSTEAREMVKRVELKDCFRPAFWKQLRWRALVEPNEDVVPIRAKFALRAKSDPTLAWNFLTSKQPPYEQTLVPSGILARTGSQVCEMPVSSMSFSTNAFGLNPAIESPGPCKRAVVTAAWEM